MAIQNHKPTKMKNDIGKSFEKFVDNNYANIDGCLVQRGNCPITGDEGYIWGNEFFQTIEDVRKAMKGIYQQMTQSIINPEKGDFI